MADITHDLGQLDPAVRYKLLTGTIVPRPIAWVTTRNADGSANAAPYSFFNAMSATPPVIVLGIAPRPVEGGFAVKDTGANIAARKDFVVNLVAQRRAGDRHLTLRGKVLSETGPEGSTRHELTDAEDLVATLREKFALDLPQIASRWPAIVARHAAVFGETVS